MIILASLGILLIPILFSFWKAETGRIRLYLSILVLASLVLSFSAYLLNWTETYTWLGELGPSFVFRVDSIGFVLAFSAVLTFLTVIASFEEGLAQPDQAGFSSMTLLGLLGVFYSGDLVTFFVFWEVMLVASFVLPIAADPTSKSAALKYFIATHVASLLLLVSIALIFGTTGESAFSVLSDLVLGSTIGRIAILLGTLAFLVKSAVFPFGFWLPDLYQRSPTPVTALLAGTVINAGVIGVVRYFQTFSTFQLQTPLLILGVVSLFYGGFVALAQSSVKRFLAYSSVSQMGYVFIGLGSFVAIGLVGAVFHAFNHALAKSVLFSSTGQYGTDDVEIDDLSGAISESPIPTFGYIVGAITLMGLPPTAGYISKLLIFSGVTSYELVLGILAGLGIAVTVGYYVKFIRVMMNDDLSPKTVAAPNATFNLALAVVLVVIVLTGVFFGAVSGFIGVALA